MSRRVSKIGLSPGTLVYTGSHTVHEESQLNLYAYDHTGVVTVHENCHHLEDVRKQASDTQRYWYDFVGVHDLAKVQKICNQFGIDPLVQEDIVNCYQRPRVDEFHDYFFIVLKEIVLDPHTLIPSSEQISFVLGKGWLISFRESSSSQIFKTVKGRLGKGRLVKYGTDYLCYALIDTIVDGYMNAEALYEDEVTTINQHVSSYFMRISGGTLQKYKIRITEGMEIARLHRIFSVKMALQNIRKWILPAREMVKRLSSYTDSDLIDVQITPYMNDVSGHLDHVVEELGALTEMLTGIGDMLLGLSSFRMNMVMKLLAVISTIFIPLTFIAGIYGMNFEHMPECQSEYGYFIVLGLMLIIMLGTIFYFRRKSWM